MKLDHAVENELMIEAVKFIHICYEELGKTKTETISRVDEVKKEIKQTGTYTHLSFELEHGARMAWRNNNRCIGRLLWHTLHVFDARHVQTADEAFATLKEHITFATNEGKIRSTITIFPQREQGKDPLRIWNHQLIRYAGYEQDGTITGDAASLSFTKTCQELGWQGAGTNFDILPLVIQEDGALPQVFPLPSSLIKEVALTHPSLTGVEKLQMKWYGVPIISDMRLEIGGIDYAMAPFNGWYMGTEIGARNLADEDRYNLLPHFAKMMGLDTKTNRSLWIDQALVELNIAVIHSFEKAGVTLIDHHTAAKQFQKFEEQENKAGRDITGNWTWLIPPVSPAATHVYHRPYKNDIVSPNYFYQEALTLDKHT